MCWACLQAFGFLMLFILFLLQATLYETLVTSAMGVFQVGWGQRALALEQCCASRTEHAQHAERAPSTPTLGLPYSCCLLRLLPAL